MATIETYKRATDRLLGELQANRWDCRPGLKIPHATSPDGFVRFWFRPQAIYLTTGRTHQFADARSLHLDMRGMSAAKLLDLLDEDFRALDDQMMGIDR